MVNSQNLIDEKRSFGRLLESDTKLRPNNRFNQVTSSNTRQMKESVWLSYAYTKEFNAGGHICFCPENNSIGKRATHVLFPDSLVKLRYSGDIFAPAQVHMLYDVLDIYAEEFQRSHGLDWDKTKNFVLDSFALNYSYYRKTPSIDTLIVYIWTEAGPGDVGYGEKPGTDYDVDFVRWRVVGYKPTENRPGRFDRTNPGSPLSNMTVIKIPLNEADTAKTYYRVLDIDISGGIEVKGGGLVYTAISFKPGYSYIEGDKLENLNTFRFVSIEENGEGTFPIYNEGDWNASGMASPDERYGDSTSVMWPPFVYPEQFQYEHHLFQYHVIGEPVGIKIDDIGFSNGVKLMQNNPNPMSAATKIKFEIDHFTNVTVVIYDITGRKVMDINEGMLSSGKHSVEINTMDLNKGTFLFMLKTDEGLSTTKKMIKY